MAHFYAALFRAPLTALLLATLPFAGRAQSVGIGTTAPDASAALDIVSSNKGALLPRVSSTGSVASPATGLIVYQTTAPTGFYYYDGSVWQQVVPASGTGFIRNQTSQQTGANFNISGGATAASVQATGNAAVGSQGAFLQWNRTGGEGETWLLNQKGLSTNGNDGIRFGGVTTGNATTEWARFIGNGQLGIGTTAPSALLDVNGSTRLRGLGAGVVQADANGNLSSSSATTAFGTSFIQNTTTQQASSSFNVSGNGTVGGTLTTQNAVVATALTGTGDDLGNTTGLGIRADGGLNIGQKTGNILLGYQAGKVTTGGGNIFMGYTSGLNNTSGSYNMFLGGSSGYLNTTGSYKIQLVATTCM